MHDWMNWVGSGLPILVLLAFWVVFMMQMRGKGKGGWFSAYRRQNELLEQQIEVLRQTNELLKKLVATR